MFSGVEFVLNFKFHHTYPPELISLYWRGNAEVEAGGV